MGDILEFRRRRPVMTTSDLIVISAILIAGALFIYFAIYHPLDV